MIWKTQCLRHVLLVLPDRRELCHIARVVMKALSESASSLPAPTPNKVAAAKAKHGLA